MSIFLTASFNTYRTQTSRRYARGVVLIGFRLRGTTGVREGSNYCFRDFVVNHGLAMIWHGFLRHRGMKLEDQRQQFIAGEATAKPTATHTRNSPSGAQHYAVHPPAEGCHTPDHVIALHGRPWQARCPTLTCQLKLAGCWQTPMTVTSRVQTFQLTNLPRILHFAIPG